MSSSITQCPECATRFRVSAEQLSVSAGMVRCGRCNAVFNAAEHLHSDEPSPQLTLAIESAPYSPVEPELGGSEKNSPAIEIAEPDAIEHQFNLDADESIEESIPFARKKRRWPWVVGAIFFLLTFLAQSVYFFRVEIAAHLPGTKPALISYCRLLKCTISLPKNPELLSIESSDLEADSTRPNAITLSALLHNRASHVQAYPNLELSLTDMQDKLVARRTFTPIEYLKAEDNEKTGLASNRDLSIKLHLETGELKPTGYKLFLFYP